jgi:uncharacterized protein (TIGR03066 family)
MRAAITLTLVLCAAGAAPVPKERLEAEKVVGTWKMTLDSRGGTDTDLELEFTQGGRMTIRQRTNGRVTEYVGTYRVVGNEMPYEVKMGTAVKAETLTIKKLTATELIVVDPDGLKEEFTRVRKMDEPKKDEKKKDEKKKDEKKKDEKK